MGLVGTPVSARAAGQHGMERAQHAVRCAREHAADKASHRHCTIGAVVQAVQNDSAAGGTASHPTLRRRRTTSRTPSRKGDDKLDETADDGGYNSDAAGVLPSSSAHNPLHAVDDSARVLELVRAIESVRNLEQGLEQEATPSRAELTGPKRSSVLARAAASPMPPSVAALQDRAVRPQWARSATQPCRASWCRSPKAGRIGP